MLLTDKKLDVAWFNQYIRYYTALQQGDEGAGDLPIDETARKHADELFNNEERRVQVPEVPVPVQWTVTQIKQGTHRLRSRH